jgi:SEC-C motif-containing protein
MKKDNKTCPCGSGKILPNCCQPYIDGRLAAPTAEALMRSRYSAYAINDEQYLLDSWHESTRPENIDADPLVQWVRLKIIDADSSQDRVEFVATFRLNGKAYKLCENSLFVFENGKWFYLEGEK